MSTTCRCKWCEKDPLYIKYHDTEWGVPVHDDQKLFECLGAETLFCLNSLFQLISIKYKKSPRVLEGISDLV